MSGSVSAIASSDAAHAICNDSAAASPLNGESNSFNMEEASDGPCRQMCHCKHRGHS